MIAKTRLVLLFAGPCLLSACSSPEPPADNAVLADAGAPLATRAVMTGSEGPRVPACPAETRVIAGGTDVFWAPDETRAVKARLIGGARVMLCEAADDDAWFGIVFPGPGQKLGECRVGFRIASPREYQGPCRSGWIKAGTTQPEE